MKLDARSIIALSLIGAMIALLFVMLFVQVPNSDVFKMAVGSFVTVGFATVINFYFGSSDGSKSKDDTLNQIALSGSPPSPPPAAPKS